MARVASHCRWRSGPVNALRKELQRGAMKALLVTFGSYGDVQPMMGLG